VHIPIVWPSGSGHRSEDVDILDYFAAVNRPNLFDIFALNSLPLIILSSFTFSVSRFEQQSYQNQQANQRNHGSVLPVSIGQMLFIQSFLRTII